MELGDLNKKAFLCNKARRIDRLAPCSKDCAERLHYQVWGCSNSRPIELVFVYLALRFAQLAINEPCSSAGTWDVFFNLRGIQVICYRILVKKAVHLLKASVEGVLRVPKCLTSTIAMHISRWMHSQSGSTPVHSPKTRNYHPAIKKEELSVSCWVLPNRFTSALPLLSHPWNWLHSNSLTLAVVNSSA